MMPGHRLHYCTLDHPQGLPEGVRLHRLHVNRDGRGVLVETGRIDWTELYGPERPFAQSYYSATLPGVARDENRWHLHQRQADRFVVVAGCIVVAMAPASGEQRQVSLVPLGPDLGDTLQAALLIPPGVLHAFVAVGPQHAILLNSPTRLYDPSDEGRVPFAEAGIRFPDQSPFAWDPVRWDRDALRLRFGDA